jgi:hypothetical protein
MESHILSRSKRFEAYEVDEKGQPIGKVIIDEERLAKEPKRFKKELPAAALNRLKGWERAGK